MASVLKIIEQGKGKKGDKEVETKGMALLGKGVREGLFRGDI